MSTKRKPPISIPPETWATIGRAWRSQFVVIDDPVRPTDPLRRKYVNLTNRPVHLSDGRTIEPSGQRVEIHFVQRIVQTPDPQLAAAIRAEGLPCRVGEPLVCRLMFREIHGLPKPRAKTCCIVDPLIRDAVTRLVGQRPDVLSTEIGWIDHEWELVQS
jgi:hypothetical protein